MIEKISWEIPDLLANTWFLDDSDTVGSLEDLQKVVDILVQEGPPRGFLLNKIGLRFGAPTPVREWGP